MLRRLLVETATSQGLAGVLQLLATYHLTDEAWPHLLRSVAGASLVQVRELAAAELRPEAEVVAIMSPRALVEKAFAEAGVAMTRWVD